MFNVCSAVVLVRMWGLTSRNIAAFNLCSHRSWRNWYFMSKVSQNVLFTPHNITSLLYSVNLEMFYVWSQYLQQCNVCICVHRAITRYCWGLANLLEMYALKLNISIAPCSWVPVTEIQSLEIVFRSCRKNIIYTAYVHTFYYINSWTCIVICKSSGMLCSFNCATSTGVAKDWHSFFMCRVKEDNKSQFSILSLFIQFCSLILFYFTSLFLAFSLVLFCAQQWLIAKLSTVFFIFIFVYFLFNLNVCV